MKQSYTYSIAPKQFATAAVINSRTASPRPYRIGSFLGSVLMFGGLGVLAQMGLSGRTVPSLVVLWAVAAAIAGFFAMNVSTLAGYRRAISRSAYLASPRTMDIEPEGLRFTSEDTQSLHRWDRIASARIAHDTVHLSLDSVTFVPIPIAAFESPAEADEFVAMVNARVKEAAVAAGPGLVTAESSLAVTSSDAAPVESPVPAADVPPTRMRQAGSMVVDALRLTFFLRPRDGRPPGSWKAAFLLTVIGVLIPTAFGFILAGLDGEWNGWALASALMHVPLLLLAAIAAALAIGRTSEVPRLFVAGLLIEIVLDVLQYLAFMLTGPSESLYLPMLYGIVGPWMILAVAVFAARQVEPSLRRFGALASCFVILMPLSSAYRDRVLWTEKHDSADTTAARDRVTPATEAVFYKQPGLLTQSLEAIHPGKKGVIDVFFVAFGGYGSQDVFRREVDATTKLMAERFGAEGHSIRLINNRSTLNDLPIASKTSLRAALNRIASVMDKDEDVLVLFMTSHGSEQHRFSLQLWPLNFEEVDPAALRTLLDESGIRNRVVIVSACYSGGFVKPLEDPDTLVVTAAAADKTSFGCSNEAEWTYFGKAYFDDGLRNTRSFTKAFEIAQPLIVEREAKVRAEKSDPQMSVGANIAPRLAALEAQLEGKATPAPKQ
ncbi:hypothetical protein DSM104443_03988 [Usitatibacter rugosus]|uniref:YcxB-like C-terminal domain-containing protein n=2 Tax=Usitatibacter rugosus TaxID=2732067 RepID=A0A6M4H2V3_9PROT|nr:hypothetical protein DSM104443_03988 [Usitatibacter rugosus]